ncbi:Outer membrane protein and related peptidoglycan-associated (lipo)protein [Hahella chejuensis KCTC 2396]|uniref:Outer membrane protein and related peptidoglycan-associated (Lipo)protein n=1 Tax=Hahella chejuensis (strain KCTC 2396) TaxID=349521 RepID=Q2SEA6_HAHCH|nr:OmpA family protein [Hahella chejuensis]ABC31018.1 Outer membrane protein and related peptidoglycan-associated (lipo)protein [Hahella chejuensis KCTC 2396]
MFRRVTAAFISVLSVASVYADEPDHPLLSRYPGASVSAYMQIDYAPFTIPASKLSGEGEPYEYQKLSLKGDLTQHFYSLENVSTLKVYKNYQAALEKSGFKSVYQCELEQCGSATQAAELGALVSPGDSVYNYYRNPYYMVYEKGAQKGKVNVALFIGGYDDEVAVQQVILEEEPLQSDLVKMDVEYLGAQPPATLMKASDPDTAKEDHPLLPRYPGADLRQRKVVDYERISIPVSALSGDDKPYQFETLDLVGDLSRHYYELENVSTLKLYENYKAALSKGGFATVYSCELQQCGDEYKSSHLGGLISLTESVYNYYRKPYFIVASKDAAKGKVYVALFIGGYEDETAVQQIILESEALEDDLITVDVDSLSRDIDETGKALLYGVFFDTDKAVVKDESKPTLEAIAGLLKKRPELLLYVTGHTDDTGAFQHNIELSSARAKAVVERLIKDYGVAQARLTPYGVGPVAPEADNLSDAGKKRNRRVELIRRLQ